MKRCHVCNISLQDCLKGLCEYVCASFHEKCGNGSSEGRIIPTMASYAVEAKGQDRVVILGKWKRTLGLSGL